jgi:hypothetical protein
MRRLAGLVLLLCTVTAGSAGANAFGQFIPASPLRGENNEFGVYMLFNSDVGVLGQARFSSGPKFDWGLQVGFAGGDETAVLLGGDIRPVLHRANDDFPLDVAFDAGLGLDIADHFTIIQVVPAVEASHQFDLEGSSSSLTPYMCLGMSVAHLSVDGGGGDTHSNLIARFGLEWEASRKLGVVGEFGAGDTTTDFILGVNVPF